MAEQETWKWQETGTAWRGVGIYHVTLVVPSREGLLGRLVIPESDPKQAVVERTEMGDKITEEALRINHYYPEIKVIQHCLMPDHLHIIYYVTKPMTQSINNVIRSLWQGVKKIGRAYSPLIYPELNSGLTDGEEMANKDVYPELNSGLTNEGDIACHAIYPESNSGLMDEGEQGGKAGDKNGGFPFPIFTERPFVRPMSHKGQLQTMIRYVQMNPQRLATKRLMPGYFRVQRDIEIAGQKYSGVGNIGILQAEKFSPVHVRRIWVEDAEQHGDATRLREYMNGCVLAARKGVVMVSPFISPKEKEVLEVLLREKHTIIYIAENGFGEYFKPAEGLFEAVAEGRMLILSPWLHDPDKPHVTRAECVAMNKMAEEICEALNKPE